MATEYKLEVQKRDEYGKKASKNLRRNGVIPGIYYSSDSKESISFSIDTNFDCFKRGTSNVSQLLKGWQFKQSQFIQQRHILCGTATHFIRFRI